MRLSTTVNVSSNGKALVAMTVQSGDTNFEGRNMAFAISGNTSVAASDTQSLAIMNESGSAFQASATYLVTGLTAGSNTFIAMYKIAMGGWRHVHVPQQKHHCYSLLRGGVKLISKAEGRETA